jgi:hypothetical protein
MHISLLLRFTAFMLCLGSTANHTAPAPGLAGHELYTDDQEWKVTIDDGWFSAKTLRYGAYSTSPRKNGVTPAANLAFKNIDNAFNFLVKDSSEQILVQALNTPRVTFSGRSLPAWLDKTPPTNPLFYMLINGTQSNPLVRWELLLKNPHFLELNDNKPVGILRSPGTDIRITAHNRFGIANSYEKLCYEFHYKGNAIAAVMPGPQPRVWVSKKVSGDMQKVLAAAIGALLFR